jgi:hypothetical protein
VCAAASGRNNGWASLQKLPLRAVTERGSRKKSSGRDPTQAGWWDLLLSRGTRARGARRRPLPAGEAGVPGCQGGCTDLLLITSGCRSRANRRNSTLRGRDQQARSVQITLHNNYTVIGPTQPAFSGAIVPAHSLNGVPEYGLGITPWFELRAYLPLYTLTRDGRFLIDGTKLRALFVSPNAAERTSGMGQFRAEL